VTADSGSRPRLLDDYDKVLWLAEAIGEEGAVQILERHFASVRARLTSRDVTHLYDARYADRLLSHPVGTVVEGKFAVNIYQAPVLRRLLADYPGRRARILDVGCGPGDFVLALAALGFEAVGLDYTPAFLETAALRADNDARHFRVAPLFLLGELQDQAPSRPFDAITLNDVVEHVSRKELRALLETCRLRLAPGGRLLVHTPNGRCFYNWTERTIKGRLLHFLVHHVRGRRVSKTIDEVYYDQVHINVMGITALRRIARRAGFRRIQVFYDDRFRIPWLSDVFSGSMTVVLD
jgi:2-polyprenyl-3-methyl-5-hydroxy-6-metoxy-1,4-benzoquinol methylase